MSFGPSGDPDRGPDAMDYPAWRIPGSDPESSTRSWSRVRPRGSRTHSTTTSSTKEDQPRTSRRTAGVSVRPNCAASRATGVVEEPVGQRGAGVLVDPAQLLVAAGRSPDQRDVALVVLGDVVDVAGQRAGRAAPADRPPPSARCARTGRRPHAGRRRCGSPACCRSSGRAGRARCRPPRRASRWTAPPAAAWRAGVRRARAAALAGDPASCRHAARRRSIMWPILLNSRQQRY